MIKNRLVALKSEIEMFTELLKEGHTTITLNLSDESCGVDHSGLKEIYISDMINKLEAEVSILTDINGIERFR